MADHLSAADELALWHRYRAGDIASRDQLLLAHEPLIQRIARRWSSLPFDDAAQEARLACLNALKIFDPAKARLSTLAALYIRAALRDLTIRTTMAPSIPSRSRLRPLMSAIKGGDEDAIQAAASAVGASPKTVEALRIAVRPVVTLLATAEDGGPVLDIASDAPGPEDMATTAESARLAQEAVIEVMGALSEREREIITSRYMAEAPRTLEDLAVVYRISRERVRQVEAAVFAKLKTALRRRALRLSAQALGSALDAVLPAA